MSKILKSSFFILACMIAFSCSTDKREFGPGVSLEEQYVGYWKALDDISEIFYIYIKEDHTCYNNHDAAHRGKWEIVGERLEIKWANGWNSFMEKTDKGFVKMAFMPGLTLDKVPTDNARIEKIDKTDVPQTVLGIFKKLEEKQDR